MVGRAISNHVKAAQALGQSRFISGVDLNRADTSATEFLSKCFGSRDISIGDDYFFKIAGARKIACRFRAHRATAAEDDDFHNTFLIGAASFFASFSAFAWLMFC